MNRSKERLTRNLRRRVRVSRRFDVESLGDGRERQTCRECKTSEIVRIAPAESNLKLIERLTAYRANGGVIGVCKMCSKQRAAELYPLPGEGWRK